MFYFRILCYSISVSTNHTTYIGAYIQNIIYTEILLREMGFKLFHSLFLFPILSTLFKIQRVFYTLREKRSNLFSLNRDYFQFILSPALAPLYSRTTFQNALDASSSVCMVESRKYFMSKMFLVRAMWGHSSLPKIDFDKK
jgi:hypothetical protein